MTVDRVMLLIDADNVSVDVIEQARGLGRQALRRPACAPRLLHGRVGGQAPAAVQAPVDPADGQPGGGQELDRHRAGRRCHRPGDRRAARRDGHRLVGLRLRAAGGAPAREGLPRHRHRPAGQDRRRNADRLRRLRSLDAPQAACRAARRQAAPQGPAAKKAVRRKRAPRRKTAAATATPPLPDKAQAILRALPALVRGDTWSCAWPPKLCATPAC